MISKTTSIDFIRGSTMKTVTPQEALNLVHEANSLSRESITDLQKERLSAIVAHTRENSTFYREKYAGLPESPSLEELPPVTKQELTAQMQDWVTDPNFSEEALVKFIRDMGTLGHLFMDKYSVSTTSGTTGEPLRMLRDSRHVNINAALLQDRLYNSPLLKNFPEIFDTKTKFASVLATGGHHAAFTAFEKRRTALEKEGITGTMELLSIGEPVKEMVARLNNFQPEVITGYPSVLRVLAGEQQEGRLKIVPKIILCSAEQLTDETRLFIEERFSCPVGNVFCSTEGGEVSILCDHGRMHLNSDWIIVEPIDSMGNSVPPGTMSDAILVTNLMNAVQPIIRYQVDDCVILHEAPCGCGLPFPYVDILGRTDDMPSFEGENGRVRLSPIVFLNAVCDIEGLSIFQFIQSDPETLVMRVQYLKEADPEVVNRQILEEIQEQLVNHGLTKVTFFIEEGEPRRAVRGKKMKAYIKDFSE
jgi:phenylacetate-coenzyme A ligase PaaK-like adenylate-forming protein